MIPRSLSRLLWPGAVLVALAGTVEWLRAPGLAPAIAAVAGALLLLLAYPGREEPWPARVATWLGVALVLVVGLGELRRVRLERGWPTQQAAIRRAGTERAMRELDALAATLDHLARAGARLSIASLEQAFAESARLVPSRGVAIGLAVLDTSGTPVAWAGTHPLPVERTGPPLSVRREGFYVVLEVRRHRPDGGSAVATGLVQAESEHISRRQTVFGRVAEATGATVRLPAIGEPARRRVQWPERQPIMALDVESPQRDEVLATQAAESAMAAGWLLVCLVVAAAFGNRLPGVGYVFLAFLPWAAARAPGLWGGGGLGFEEAFSPASFFSPLLGPFSASAGVLALTGLVAFALAVGLWHLRLPWFPLRRVLGVVALGAAPYLVREFGRGITPPAPGVPDALWMSWHLGLLLPASALLVTAAALLRPVPAPMKAAGGWLALAGGALALAAGAIGLVVFTGRPAWPAWYTACWIPALVLASRAAPFWASVVAIGLVAGTGASLITWGASMAGRTEVALRDVARLGPAPDALVEPLLLDFASGLVEQAVPTSAGDLYRHWRRSGLREQGYPAHLMLVRDGQVRARVRLDDLGMDDSVFVRLAAGVESWHPAVVRPIGGPGAARQVLTAPMGAAGVLVLATGSRSVVVPPAPLGRVLETGPERTTLYRLTVHPGGSGVEGGGAPRWRREGWALRTTRSLGHPTHPAVAHVTIPLGRPGSLLVRGGLVILLDVFLLAVLWLLAERVVGVARAPRRMRERVRSFQVRLALSLSLFFAAPAVLLAGLSTRQLAGEAEQSRDLVLERVLRDAMPAEGFPDDSLALVERLAQMARRVDADLALYLDGRRRAVSEPLLAELGVFPGLLHPEAQHAIRLDGERYVGQGHRGTAIRVGYVPVQIVEVTGWSAGGGEGGAGAGAPGAPVLATAAASPERAIRERQRDVVFTLLLATLLGVLAAAGAARRAAQALSRPVAALRSLALALGQGSWVDRDAGGAGGEGGADQPAAPPPPLAPAQQPLEFQPVFEAFHRMAQDVRTSQVALEASRRRIETVLATVATGVIAVDAAGRVRLANARAEQALQSSLPEGSALVEALRGPWRTVAELLAGGGDGVEVEAAGRRFEVRVAPLPPLGGEGGDAGVGGRVLAITDVTESTRAARVLAWAEVANQVAHAIKNPLTPLRLGIQHLQRVREQRPARFDDALSETSARILAEIERLDAMARAFARLAAPGAQERPVEPVDCAAAAHEVAALYRMAPDLSVVVEIAPGTRVLARRDELAEVLINLCDNARNAGARRIVLRHRDGVLEVEDDGAGITAEHLPRIFEPRFSTQSSGSGLGLAIVRRLVESWGASVSVESQPGQGTRFRVTFQRAGGQPTTSGR